MFIVFDTCTFLKALGGIGKYKETLDLIKEICDTIIVSKEIEKEYRSKLHSEGMNITILQNKLSTLKAENKYKCIKRSRINGHLSSRNIQLNVLPEDRYDRKLFKLAAAENAKCIITTDTELLAMSPYRYGSNEEFEIILPENYETESR